MYYYTKPSYSSTSSLKDGTDRYPGLRSFDRDEGPLFFGRDAETDSLYHQVKYEKTSVLFGKSGLGKSSLINAGLIPVLLEKNFLPIRIRFGIYDKDKANNNNNNNNYLLNLFRIAANKEVSDYIKNSGGMLEDDEAVAVFDAKETVWENVKKLGRTIIRYCPLLGPVTPVLIFDQFEEFFTFPTEEQKAILHQLGELVHDSAPSRILEPLLTVDTEDRSEEMVEWSLQPDIRFIFSIRADCLSSLNTIRAYFPIILKNRYELMPLHRDRAKDAITEPADIDSNKFIARSFDYKPDVLELIVNYLSGDSGDIESSQLQIVCSYIEELVKKTQQKEYDRPTTPNDTIEENNRFAITSKIVNTDTLKDILDNFYEHQLNKIEDLTSKMLARKIIEEHLIADGRRASLTDAQMKAKIRGQSGLLQKMLDTRLIREEYTHLGLTYEVSHDTLVAPIEKAFKQRQERELARNLEEQAKKLQEQELQLKEEAKLRETAEHATHEALEAKKDAILQRDKVRRHRHVLIALAVLQLFAFITVLTLGKRHLDTVRTAKKQLARIVSLEAINSYNNLKHYQAFRLRQHTKNYDDSIAGFDKPFYALSGSKILFSERGNWVISKYPDNSLDIWDVIRDSLALHWTINVPTESEIYFNEDESILTTESVARVQFWNLKTKQEILFKTHNPLDSLRERGLYSLSPDGSYLFVRPFPESKDKSIRVTKAKKIKYLKLISAQEDSVSIKINEVIDSLSKLYKMASPRVSFTRNGERILVNFSKNGIIIFDLRAFRAQRFDNVKYYAITHQGKAFLAYYGDGMLKETMLDNHTDRWAIKYRERVIGLAYYPVQNVIRLKNGVKSNIARYHFYDLDRSRNFIVNAVNPPRMAQKNSSNLIFYEDRNNSIHVLDISAPYHSKLMPFDSIVMRNVEQGMWSVDFTYNYLWSYNDVTQIYDANHKKMIKTSCNVENGQISFIYGKPVCRKINDHTVEIFDGDTDHKLLNIDVPFAIYDVNIKEEEFVQITGENSEYLLFLNSAKNNEKYLNKFYPPFNEKTLETYGAQTP